MDYFKEIRVSNKGSATCHVFITIEGVQFFLELNFSNGVFNGFQQTPQGRRNRIFLALINMSDLSCRYCNKSDGGRAYVAADFSRKMVLKLLDDLTFLKFDGDDCFIEQYFQHAASTAECVDKMERHVKVLGTTRYVFLVGNVGKRCRLTFTHVNCNSVKYIEHYRKAVRLGADPSPIYEEDTEPVLHMDNPSSYVSFSDFSVSLPVSDDLEPFLYLAEDAVVPVFRPFENAIRDPEDPLPFPDGVEEA